MDFKGRFIFPTKTEALIAERFIKNQKSRKIIENIIGEGYRFRNQILANEVRTSDFDLIGKGRPDQSGQQEQGSEDIRAF